ncbi:hypothetical protein [Archangium sp.]|uniref:hypothetical protein n=1 Tax=Archangium sp. TaxID=1872627 RepID=UPI00389ABA27
MTTPAAALVAAPATLRRVGADPLHLAMERLGHALPERTDSTVLLDFLEDDLREGLEALEDVEAHFTDVLEALEPGTLSPLALIQAGEDQLVLQRLEVLMGAVTRVRRRLSQAAGLMRQATTT